MLYKKSTNWLERLLQKHGFASVGIHGDKVQNEREQALSDFNSGTANILVATDVASRGLDFKDVQWVLNFEFPPSCTEYIHRIGIFRNYNCLKMLFFEKNLFRENLKTHEFFSIFFEELFY
jgi:superfamily II DNA/RNA helicase